MLYQRSVKCGIIIAPMYRFPFAMRIGVPILCSVAGIFTGICQNILPPQFDAYTGPTTALPDTHITFSMFARSRQTNDCELDYDLLAAPTNTVFSPVWGRPPCEKFAAFGWRTPSRSAVGTTNVFVVRATDHGNPPLSETNTLGFVLIDLPPIHIMIISNGVATFQFTNPIPYEIYQVQWSADLTTTNWLLLNEVSSASNLVSATDTNSLERQRFYRIVPTGWSYGLGP